MYVCVQCVFLWGFCCESVEYVACCMLPSNVYSICCLGEIPSKKKSDITITLVALNYCTSGNLHFSVKLFYSVSDPDLYSILVAMLGEELCQFWGSSVKKNILVF